MRILLVTGEYPPDTPGGIGSFVACAARALTATGSEVHVLVCAKAEPATDTMDGGAFIHRRPMLRAATFPLRGRVGGRTALALSLAHHAHRLGRFDVVEAPDWQAMGLGFVLVHRTPTVVCLHTPDAVIRAFDQPTASGAPRIAMRAVDRLDSFAARRATAVTSPSNLLVHTLRASGWLRRSESRVQRAPLDLAEWIGAGPVENTQPTVLGMGRLEHRKGFDVLIRAIGLLRGEVPNIRVVLAGADGLRSDGTKWSSYLLGLAGAVGVELELTGSIPRNDLLPLLTSSRVVAVPSRFDNFAMSALEGLAAARPLVCTDHVGVAELDDGSAAITAVPVDDPGAFAHALLPHLADRSAAARAGRLGQAIVTAACDPQVFARKRLALYREVISKAS